MVVGTVPGGGVEVDTVTAIAAGPAAAGAPAELPGLVAECRGALAELAGLVVADLLCPGALGELAGLAVVIPVEDLLCPRALAELPAPAVECPGAVPDRPGSARLTVPEPAPPRLPKLGAVLERSDPAGPRRRDPGGERR